LDELEFGDVDFVEVGKLMYLEKKPSEQGESQKQTEPTYGNRARIEHGPH